MHSAFLKVERAKKHIEDANELLGNAPPFLYVLWTNKITGVRSIRTKRDEAAAHQFAISCGDAVHNLRSALDHAYWGLVSPHCATESQRKNVQFPFAARKDSLANTLKNRLVDLAGPDVRREIEDLEPYKGGDELFYMIYELDNLDKHKLLIPTADYKTVSGTVLKNQVPDFPFNIQSVTSSDNPCDFEWQGTGRLALGLGGRRVTDLGVVYEEELRFPIDIIFDGIFSAGPYRVIPTLERLVGKTVYALKRLLPAADTPPGY